MRTSLNDIKEIETYLCKKLSIGERLVFEARMVVDKKLRQDVALQKKTYSIIQHHYRIALKKKFEVLHDHLFHDMSRKTVKEKIINLFKS